MRNPPRRHRKQPRTHSRKHREPELISHLAAALDSRHPIDLLALASSLLEVATPDPTDQLTGVERRPLTDMLDSMLGTDRRETTALLTVWREMLTDPKLVASVERELEGRRHQLPRWLRDIDDANIERAALVSDDYGDTENVLLDIGWSGKSMTTVTLIDHLAGGAVKDAFVVDRPFSEVSERYGTAEGTLTLNDLDRGVARAMLEVGIAEGRRIFPPYESDSWPQMRPLLAWLARLLPRGARLPDVRELDDSTIRSLLDRFFASPFSTYLDRRRHEDAVSMLVSYAGRYGRADPLAWSPAVVEILLDDWYPRKVFAPPEHGVALAEALPAFVRFAHAERGLPERATGETLDAVRHFTAGFMIRLAEDVENWIETIDDWDAYELGRLADRVGGVDALESLSTEPLPDEPFDWSDVDEDITDRTSGILEMLDRYCDERLDHADRTVARRMLARIARGEPEVFRRRALPEAIPAGIVFLAVGSNESDHDPTTKSILEWFRLKPGYSLSDRAIALRRALGAHYLPGRPYSEIDGDASLFTAATRMHIIEQAERRRLAIRGRQDGGGL